MFFQKRPCSRCPRIDEIQVTAEEMQHPKEEPTAVYIVVRGEEEHNMQHLCDECRVIVDTHLEIITKRLEKTSSRRKVSGKKKKPPAPAIDITVE